MQIDSPPGSHGIDGPAVVPLRDDAATDPQLTGGKASALAQAARAGLPAVDGFAVTTAAIAAVDAVAAVGVPDPVEWALGDEVRRAWSRWSQDGRRALAVRSSSVAEDQASSSMAGRFASVVGVTEWNGFLDAVRTVLDSRRVAAGDDGATPRHPMAVLVQPVVDADAGGVLFGVDPVTGRSDRMVVVAAESGPQAVVAGEVAGTRYVLDHDGEAYEVRRGRGGVDLDGDQLDALVSLAEKVAAVFGGPQDVEFALDRDATLWLLQSRPVTTAVVGTPVGPTFTPGPVAETFPLSLSRLEQDMWVRPLRRALRHVLELVGTLNPSVLASSPLVVCPGGRVAVDAGAFGLATPSGWRAHVDPRPRLRRLRAAWRVGRLRAALPALAGDVLDEADAALLAVPDVTELTDRQLLDLLDRAGRALVALHGHEMLIGLVIRPGAAAVTGVAVALRVLSDERRRGRSDEDIAAGSPVVLALVPPRIQPVPPLPQEKGTAPPPRSLGTQGDDAALRREALRLRARWVQELSGRAAWVLGERLARRGVLREAADVRHLRLAGLRALATGRAVLWQLTVDEAVDEPLPARFRLSGAGEVVADADGTGDGAGVGAGGGIGAGTVVHDAAEVRPGAVLVVTTLGPELAPHLPRLAGLVAETGSPLAHLAILAREHGVPVVVGADGARLRFAAGARVRVDGASGQVTEAGRNPR